MNSLKITAHVKNSGAILALLALLVLPAIGLMIGCTSTLDGEQTANQAPNVFFVNIPPEGQQFSRNPVVFWFGSDPDGLIDFYRHHVATRADVDAVGDPMAYIATIPDNAWVINDVAPDDPNPQTKQSIPLQADASSPVLTFVDQYVFIQAYDEVGLGSDIKVRLFSRNNNPPETQIAGYSPFLPFVNDVKAGAITGVRMSWVGTDEIDWPSDPPPFEFQWRLYGPYTDAEYADLQANFFTEVLQTADGRLFRFGDSLEICDTNLLADSVEITCTTYVVDANIETALPTGFASLEPLFAIDDSAFINDPVFNRVSRSSDEEPAADENGWVFATSDTIFDVFATDPSDTTVQKKFVFWVRSRDDAQTPDLTPAFTFGTPVEVINPKRERDVIIVDYQSTTGLNLVGGPYRSTNFADDTVLQVYSNLIRNWQLNREVDTVLPGSDRLWDPERDYYRQAGQSGEIPLRVLVSHRIILLHNDASFRSSQFLNSANNLFKAIDGGVNAWLSMRCTILGSNFQSQFEEREVFGLSKGIEYAFYFGVTRVIYSGWGCSAVAPVGFTDEANCPGGRIEDFIGTYTLRPDEYPEVSIDSSLLHSRYRWTIGDPSLDSAFGWDPYGSAPPEPIGALPEVGWSGRVTPGTEIIYLYKSLYGDNHPNGFQYSFEGSPVAHRFDRGNFRTAHFNFTVIPLPEAQAQTVVNSTLNFLFTPTQQTGSGRASSAPAQATTEELAENYMRRVMESADPEDFDPIQYDGRFHQKALQEMYQSR